MNKLWALLDSRCLFLQRQSMSITSTWHTVVRGSTPACMIFSWRSVIQLTDAFIDPQSSGELNTCCHSFPWFIVLESAAETKPVFGTKLSSCNDGHFVTGAHGHEFAFGASDVHKMWTMSLAIWDKDAYSIQSWPWRNECFAQHMVSLWQMYSSWSETSRSTIK